MSVNLGVNIQRSPNRINQQLREAGVIGKFPKLLLDFTDNYYLANGGSKTLANAVTHARAGNATMTDGYGPELLSNGDFSDGVTRWSTNGNPTVSLGVVTIPIEDSATKYIEQFVTAPVGKTYIVTAKITDADVNSRQLRVSAHAGKTGAFTGNLGAENFAISTTGANISFVFTPTSNQYTTIRFIVNSSTNGHFSSFDNVSVREMPAIKWAPHNLLSVSNDFQNAIWAPFNTTITPNAATSPDGTTNAFEMEHSNVSAQFSETISGGFVDGINYTLSIFVKSNGADFFRLFGDGGNAYFNLSTGAKASISGTTVSSSMNDVGNGWYHCAMTAPATGTGFSISLLIPTGDLQTGEAVGESVYLYGCHVYRSDLGGMADNPERGDSYVPTTSSAKYLPRIGHHVYNGNAWVNEGLLAESEARTNIFTDNHDIDGYSFTQRMTTTANEGVSPAGLEDALECLETASTGEHTLSFSGRFSFVSGKQYTVSAYVKAIGGRNVKFGFPATNFGSQSRTIFKLEDQQIVVNAAADSSTIQEVGNGWYRISVTDTATVTGSTGTQLILQSLDGETGTYLGDITKGFYVYGFQLEEGPTPSSYIPTIGSSVTRALETFTVPSANLPWPTPQYIGSELVTNGTFDTDSDWTKGTGWTISGGKANLDASVAGAGVFTQIYQNVPTTAGKVYALSANFDTLTNVTDSEIFLRVEVGAVLSKAQTTTGTKTYYFVAQDSSTTISIDAGSGHDGDETVVVDNISVREINPLSVSIGMEGRVTFVDTDTNQEAVFYQWLDSSDFILNKLRTDGSRTGQLYISQSPNGGNVSTGINLYSADVLVPYNIASRHGSTFINAAADGVALTADTTPTALPDLSSADLNLAKDYMGTVSEFRVWDRDITDAGLVEATEPSLEPSLSLTFEGVGTNSFVVNDWSQ